MKGLLEIQKLKRPSVLEFLDIVGLCGFAVAQPLYDLLGQNAAFFVAHRASSLSLLCIALGLTVGIPIVLALLEVTASLFGENARRFLHLLFVGLLIGLAALPPLNRIPALPTLALLLLALVISVAAAYAYAKWRPVRAFASLLAVAALVFPLNFLLLTPISSLVLSSSVTPKAEVEVQHPVPIVLVLFDEFNTTALLDESARIDSVRFPNFGALARESWWFPNAVAADFETTHSIVSILTGQEAPSAPRINPSASEYPNNLFTLLDGQYHLNASEPMTALCASPSCRSSSVRGTTRFDFQTLISDMAIVYAHLITPMGLRDRLPSLNIGWAGFGGSQDGGDTQEVTGDLKEWKGRRGRQMGEFLGAISSEPVAQLNFLHVVFPHRPYRYLATGQIYQESEDVEGLESGGVTWREADGLIRTAYYRYLHQVGFADRFLGALLKHLKDIGLYENALVIVTADHGVSFRPQGAIRRVDRENVTDILKVPMFVKLPKQQQGGIKTQLVSNMDVLPTIAKILGVRVPWKLDGRSMIDQREPERTEIHVARTGFFSAKELEGFPRLAWQARHFGARTPLERTFLGGSSSTLIGRELSALKIGAAAALQIISDDLQHFEDVNLESGSVPALLRGNVEGNDKSTAKLAIALNNRIWAATETVRWDNGKNFFSVLLPPLGFINGSNSVDVFSIDESASEVILRPIQLRSGMLGPNSDPKGLYADGSRQSPFTLRRDFSGKEWIEHSNRQRWTVTAGREVIRGNLDYAKFDNGVALFDGWAIDVRNSKPAQRVMVFANDRLIGEAEPRFARFDVVRDLRQRSLLHSGFNVSIPVERLPAPLEDIRFFVVAGRNAVEFAVPDDGLAQIYEALGERLIGQSGHGAVLAEGPDSRLALKFADGVEVRVDAQWGTIRGNVDKVLHAGPVAIVEGWAADLVAYRPVRSVLAFSGERLVGMAVPRKRRDDLVQTYGRESVRFAGFSVKIPRNLLDQSKRLRVFVVSASGGALELRLREEAATKLTAIMSGESTRETGEVAAAND